VNLVVSDSSAVSPDLQALKNTEMDRKKMRGIGSLDMVIKMLNV
jgi:hypothetical protein